MRIFKAVLFFMMAFVALAKFMPTTAVGAPVEAPAPKSAIHFFYGEGCPHCSKAKPFVTNLVQKYSQLELKMYEVWNNKENLALLYKMAAEQGFDPQTIPVTFIGKSHYEGFDDKIAQKLESDIKAIVETSKRGS